MNTHLVLAIIQTIALSGDRTGHGGASLMAGYRSNFTATAT